jgi:hypothetical protein
VVTGFLGGGVALRVLSYQRDALDLELLVPDKADDAVEILPGQVPDRVCGDDNVELGVTHGRSLAAAGWF